MKSIEDKSDAEFDLVGLNKGATCEEEKGMQMRF